MNAISNTTTTAAAVSEQTIASLQAQLSRYAQAASGPNKQASVDYKALQSAIQSGNVSAAQAALSRLQRDNASTPAAAPGRADPAQSLAVASESKTANPNSLDATA